MFHGEFLLDAGRAVQSRAASAPSRYGMGTLVNDCGAYPQNQQKQETQGLLQLPAELLHEVAVCSCPLSVFRLVVRFDIRLAACVRIQRTFRLWSRQDKTRLSVGERVLLRSAAHGLKYATAAAPLLGSSMWKLRLLDGTYIDAPSSRICRLGEWADGPWTSTVGRSVASKSASKARKAALRAAALATQALQVGGSTGHATLAVAAASAASTAAAAASAASSVASPHADADAVGSDEARELLQTAHLIQQTTAILAEDERSAAPAAARAGSMTPRRQAHAYAMALSLAAQAADAAAEAAKEAASATSAATVVDSVGTLPVTALTAATASIAAQQVAAAVKALEESPTAAGDAVAAAAAAASAIAGMGQAGCALTSAWAQPVAGAGGSEHSVATANVFRASQEAAEALRTATHESIAAGLAEQTRAGKSQLPSSRAMGDESSVDESSGDESSVLPSGPSALAASTGEVHADELAASTTQVLELLQAALSGGGELARTPPKMQGFERLVLEGERRPCAAPAFESHSAYRLPVDRIAEPSCPQGSTPSTREVHSFVLVESIAAPLNQQLTQLACAMKQRDGKTSLGPRHHNQRSQTGGRSDRSGGFQSLGCLFDDKEHPCCAKLHGYVSAALEELGEANVLFDDDILRPDPGGVHPAHAWFNINAGMDAHNVLHTHDHERWSAVYYVGAGGTELPSCGGPRLPSKHPLGCMVFRADDRYFDVSPVPGTLWIFPGSLPHLVMPQHAPPGLLRVSIGMNFHDAMPPPPALALVSHVAALGRHAAESQPTTPQASHSDAQPRPPSIAFDVDGWLDDGRTQLLDRASLKTTAAARTRRGQASQTSRQDCRVEEARARSAALSVTADTRGVKFSGREFQRLYYASKFVKRARLVFDFFGALHAQGGSGPGDARQLVAQYLSAQARGKGRLEACFVGGGPGNDAAGLVAAAVCWLGYTPPSATPNGVQGRDDKEAIKAARSVARCAAVAAAEADERCIARTRRAQVMEAKAAQLRAPASCKEGPPNASGNAHHTYSDSRVRTTRMHQACVDADAAAALAAQAAASARLGAEEAALRYAAAKLSLTAALAAPRAYQPTGDCQRERGPLVHASLLDNEPQWKYYVATVERLCAPLGATVDFSSCDVVRDLAECPETVRAKLACADLLVFCYVCHETSEAASAGGHLFYCGLTHHCKDGALLVFFDIIGRAAKCFDDLYAAMRSEAERSSATDETPRDETSGGDEGRTTHPRRSSTARRPRLRRIPLPAGICSDLHTEIMMLHFVGS